MPERGGLGSSWEGPNAGYWVRLGKVKAQGIGFVLAKSERGALGSSWQSLGAGNWVRLGKV